MHGIRRLWPIALLVTGCPDDGGGSGEEGGSTSDASATSGPSTSSTTASTGVEGSTGIDETSAGSTSLETTGGTTGAGTEGSSSTGEAVEPCFETTLDVSVCDPETATFGLESTNVYYPLVVGLAVVLEGMEGTDFIRIERTVLEDTEMVAGVETHVLQHFEYVDMELVEVARNYYVEASDGTVCYFGEDVDNYVGGVVDNHDGSWRAGENGAVPGIIMPADPMVGDAYYQEFSPPDALDMGQVDAVGTTEMIGDMSYDDVVTIVDWDPLDGCEEGEPKRYIPDIGEADDNGVVLIEYTPGG